MLVSRFGARDETRRALGHLQARGRGLEIRDPPVLAVDLARLDKPGGPGAEGTTRPLTCCLQEEIYLNGRTMAPDMECRFQVFKALTACGL
jgi:hypothetical protein